MNGNKPTYPIPTHGHHGLTKREHFAGLAMQAIISKNPALSGDSSEMMQQQIDWISRGAVQYADALLAELEVPS